MQSWIFHNGAFKWDGTLILLQKYIRINCVCNKMHTVHNSVFQQSVLFQQSKHCMVWRCLFFWMICYFHAAPQWCTKLQWLGRVPLVWQLWRLVWRRAWYRPVMKAATTWGVSGNLRQNTPETRADNYCVHTFQLSLPVFHHVFHHVSAGGVRAQ